MASTAMIAFRAGGLRIAMWIELKPPQEIPNMPTLPFENGCARQPGDDLVAVALLDLAVLVGDQRALAVAGAADVDARDDVAAAHEVGIQVVAAAASLVLAVGQVLEQHRKAAASPVALGPPQVGGELHAVAHRDANLFERNVEDRGRRRRDLGAGFRRLGPDGEPGEEQQGQDSRPHGDGII